MVVASPWHSMTTWSPSARMRVGVMLDGAVNCSYSGLSSRSRTSALPTYSPDQAVDPMIRQTKSSAIAAMNGALSRRDRAAMMFWARILVFEGVMAAPLDRGQLALCQLEHGPGQAPPRNSSRG